MFQTSSKQSFQEFELSPKDMNSYWISFASNTWALGLCIAPHLKRSGYWMNRSFLGFAISCLTQEKGANRYKSWRKSVHLIGWKEWADSTFLWSGFPTWFSREGKGESTHASERASESDGDPASTKLEFVNVGAGERSWILMICMWLVQDLLNFLVIQTHTHTHTHKQSSTV